MKKMRRTLLCTAVILLILLILLIPILGVPTRITAEKLSRDTGLAFYLLEKDPDFSKDYNMIGGFGITGYFDRKYGDANANESFDIQKTGEIVYYVSKWKDTLMGQRRITRIVVGNPGITVLGCSVGDSTDAFVKALTESGFRKTDGLHVYRKNGVYISLSPDEETKHIKSFTLYVNSSNLFGIQY